MALKTKWNNRQKEIKDWIKKERKRSKVGEWKEEKKKSRWAISAVPEGDRKTQRGLRRTKPAWAALVFVLSTQSLMTNTHLECWITGPVGLRMRRWWIFATRKQGLSPRSIWPEPHSSQLSSKTTGQDWKTEMLRAKRETERWKERVGGGRKTNILLMQRRLIQTLADRSMFTLHSRRCNAGCLFCLQCSSMHNSTTTAWIYMYMYIYYILYICDPGPQNQF